jgi:hypothetical protein
MSFTPNPDTESGAELVTAEFEVTNWQQADSDQRSRAFVSKTFTGALAGTSEAELLLAGGESGRGYIAHEVFHGTLNGSSGTLVFQHGGIDDGVRPFTYGYIVPGCGTGELAGIRGQISYSHDESGARVELTLEP